MATERSKKKKRTTSNYTNAQLQPVLEFLLEYEFENVHQLPHGHKMNSPVLNNQLKDDGKYKWSVTIEHAEVGGEECLNVVLLLDEDCESSEIEVFHGDCSIKSFSGEPDLYYQASQSFEISPGECIYVPRFMPFDTLEQFTFARHGQLRLQCKIELTAVMDEEHNHAEHLSMDLQRILQNGKENFADLSIVTASRTFRVHKFMLAARSPVFAAMFQAGMVEAQSNSVNIPDFDARTVYAMIQYIYTGCLSYTKLTRICVDLLRIADKYQLEHLKTECENVMAGSISEDNLYEYLDVAHLHSPDVLLPKLLQFIKRNEARVTKTSDFDDWALTNPTLLLRLYKEYK